MNNSAATRSRIGTTEQKTDLLSLLSIPLLCQEIEFKCVKHLAILLIVIASSSRMRRTIFALCLLLLQGQLGSVRIAHTSALDRECGLSIWNLSIAHQDPTAMLFAALDELFRNLITSG
jgi:hypothetical protein